jgi:transcriptional regulator with XRE-family HTH domain
VIHRAITEEIIRRRLSINVRTLRNGARLTLKRSSERAEMHWRHWQKIEAGQVNITLQTLVRLADVLGIDPADLLREPKGGDPKAGEAKASDPKASDPKAGEAKAGEPEEEEEAAESEPPKDKGEPSEA